MTAWNVWEDYRAGLYSIQRDESREADAARLLADPDQFLEAAREMLREWPNAAIHNLRHMWSGRNAWIGQATCCYSVAATAADTRAAWGTLTNQQQAAANDVARKVRDEWERGVHDAQTRLAI